MSALLSVPGAPFWIYSRDSSVRSATRLWGVRYHLDGRMDLLAGWDGEPDQWQLVERSVAGCASHQTDAISAGYCYVGLRTLQEGRLIPSPVDPATLVDWIFDLYRARGEKRTRNWAICPHPDGSAVLRWGPLGRLPHARKFGAEVWAKQQAQRVKAKLASGYQYHGRVRIDAQGTTWRAAAADLGFAETAPHAAPPSLATLLEVNATRAPNLYF